MATAPATSTRQLSAERASAVSAAWWAPVAAILLGAGLLMWNLHGFGYTADEVAELLKARRPWSDILRDVDDDLFPPLYQIVLAEWIQLWGTEAAARWLNALLGVTALVVVWRAAVELRGERDSFWPTLLFATCPFQIHFSREGRAYALYSLLAALMFWGALRVLNHGSWANWRLFVGASAAAVYTHYYAGPLAACLAALLLAATARRDGWRRAVAAIAVLALLLAPAPWLLLRALGDLPDENLFSGFDVETLGYTYVSLATGFTAGPAMQELRDMPATDGIRLFLPWLAAIGFSYVALGWSAWRRLPGSALALLLAPLLLLVPVMGVIGNQTATGYVFRYFVWMSIPYALVLGAGASRREGRPLVAVAVLVLLAVNLIAIVNRRTNPRYAEEDFRAVAAKLDELDPAHGPVLVASHYMGAALKYYVGDSRPLASFPIFSNQSDDRASRIEEYKAAQPPGSYYFIVSQWLPGDDVRRKVRDDALDDLNAKLEVELNQAEIYSARVD